MSDRELVDMMESVWRSITDLCATFDESQWKSPTDCPGWSVQDQLSHLAGSESMYLGRPSPDHTARDTSHVKNEIGERNAVRDHGGHTALSHQADHLGDVGPGGA